MASKNLRRLVVPSEASLRDALFVRAVVAACDAQGKPLQAEEVASGAAVALHVGGLVLREAHAAVHGVLGDAGCTCRAEDVEVCVRLAAGPGEDVAYASYVQRAENLAAGSAARLLAWAAAATHGYSVGKDDATLANAIGRLDSMRTESGSPLLPALPTLGARRVKDESVFVYDWAVERVPRADTRNVLVTSALPYVNNVPHLGNIIGAVLSADVYARYSRLRGRTTLYVCGTDEYGTATETKALEEGTGCAELCAKYFRLHAGVYAWFGISTDHFGRSSTPRQTAITHEIFGGLHGNGYFSPADVAQAYCAGCARFLADRYVEGTCPACGYGDARGDQCDGCGRLLSPLELVAPRCKVCRGAPETRTSTHLFLDLAALQPLVARYVEAASGPGKWSANSAAISRAWLAEGLRPRCMTRDLRWGTPVPLPGYEDKVFYVWFDACIGYVSITAGYTPEHWRRWWQPGADAPVELHQFMGKDNVPFHTVIFPCTLMGTAVGAEELSRLPPGDAAAADALIQRCPWVLMHHINTTEYLNYEDGKFSKSRGVGVFGNDARDAGIPQAFWRYYLLSVRPETTDAAFSWDDFCARVNSELVANVGNLAARVTKFCATKMGGTVPARGEPGDAGATLVKRINEELCAYREAFESGGKIRDALRVAMSAASAINAYLTSAKLDGRLLAEDPLAAGTVVALSLNALHLLSSLLEPFVPSVAADLRRLLNAPGRAIPAGEWDTDVLLPGHAIHPRPFHLFARVERSLVDDLRVQFSGRQAH